MKKFLKQLWILLQHNKKLKKASIFLYSIFNGNKKKIKGKGNNINNTEALLKSVSITIKGDNNSVNIGRNTRIINTNIIIVGNNHQLNIEENCLIKNSGFSFENNNSLISIGKQTTMEGVQAAAIENTSIKIGEDCMFSAGISLRTGDSHSVIHSETLKRLNYANDIYINNHVWIGESVKILKGAQIGEHSIIGIGAIVTKKVPSYCIAAGIPAKVVKENTDWLRERVYN